jgi:hypothetical protein
MEQTFRKPHGECEEATIDLAEHWLFSEVDD